MQNVGSNRGTKLERYPKQFFAAVKSLENDGFIVKKIECKMSGCCQYHANAYYVVGEMTLKLSY